MTAPSRPVSPDALGLYEALFEQLLPKAAPPSIHAVEVYGITPERFDPFSAGLRVPGPFCDADIPLPRPYPVRAPGPQELDVVNGAETSRRVGEQSGGIVLRVYVGPIEWAGPDDADVEAGVGIEGGPTRHWLWRLARTGGRWRVLRCDRVWAG